MFFTVTKTAIISLILIILVHSSYIFLKTNLTIPKIKDLVDKPDIGYKEIYNTIHENKKIQPQKKNINKNENTQMKNELKEYLKSLSREKKEPIGGTLGDDQFTNYKTLN
jgi:cell shape-determining protein MreC